MSKLKIILAVILLCLLGVVNLSSQEVEDTMVPTTEEEVGELAPEEIVSLNFKDADIRSVLRIIAYKSGVNIVSTPEVRGAVTIMLKNVPWERALETIVRTYGFAYEWISDEVIMVSTLERLTEQRRVQEEAAAQEPMDTATFILNFTRAEDIKVAMEKLISAKGKITVEPRSNALIITDTKSNLVKIGKIIQRLDKVTPQVTIEAKIVEATLDDDDKLGIDWTTKVTLSGAKRPVTFPFQTFEGARNYYPVPAYESSYESGMWTITSDFPFGGEGFFFPGQSHGFSSFPGAQAYFKDGVLQGDFAFGTLDFSQFKAVLELLKSKSDTKIVSNPRITTINNEEAKIIVGTIVPIPIYEYSREAGTRVIAGYRDQEIGIKLSVTPNVNEEEFVTLIVKPSVDEIIGWTGPDDERPIISTRNANTKVMIKDGQTLVIGGLISEKKIKSRTKVPILGDIPILGFFFSKRDDTLDKTELIIFITPRIVNPD
ncbi:MAG: type IV pilus secretin PilQ [Candidatus Omnitrophota bacterium]|jgi:type IV pilus assembly protein PilQ